MAGSKSRVAIIGAAGVGKTTLLDNLFKDNNVIQSYSRIDEIVRRLCAERGYDSPYTIEGDMNQFRMDVLDRQIAEENSHDRFIVDRSTIDAWAYFMRWSWNTSTIEQAEEFYNKAYNQAQKYDLLVYIPIMFPVEDDGYRWANPLYQKQVDRLLKSLIKDWVLEDRVYEIKSEQLGERLVEIRENAIFSINLA